MDRIRVWEMGMGKCLSRHLSTKKPCLRSWPNRFIVSFNRLSHWQLRKEPLKHMFPYGPNLKWGNKPVKLPFRQTNRKSRWQVRDFRNSCRESGQAVEARFSSSKRGSAPVWYGHCQLMSREGRAGTAHWNWLRMQRPGWSAKMRPSAADTVLQFLSLLRELKACWTDLYDQVMTATKCIQPLLHTCE